MDDGFGGRCLRVELHRVGLDPGDGGGVSGEQAVRDLRQHGIGQVLHHQGHAVRLRPAQAQQRAGLGFACFQRHAGPSQFASAPDLPPVVGAFVEKERAARTHGVNRDRMFVEFIRKRLLHIKKHGENPWLFIA